VYSTKKPFIVAFVLYLKRFFMKTIYYFALLVFFSFSFVALSFSSLFGAYKNFRYVEEPFGLATSENCPPTWLHCVCAAELDKSTCVDISGGTIVPSSVNGQWLDGNSARNYHVIVNRLCLRGFHAIGWWLCWSSDAILNGQEHLNRSRTGDVRHHE
jgi:hypothetical protein